MQETIEVYDDFFSEEIHKEVWDLMCRPKWNYTGGDEGNLFWHMNRLHEEEYFNNYLYNIILEKLRIPFQGVNRIYANGQTAGQCGTPHTDDGDLTFLYFPNPEWEVNWEGHTTFLNVAGPRFMTEGWQDWEFPFDEPYDISQVVSYKPNRAILFPSHIAHYSNAPHRLFNGLRVSIAFKLLT